MPRSHTDSSHQLPGESHQVVVALVPDTDGELRSALAELEDLALSLAGCEDDDVADQPVPQRDPLRSGLAAGALGRINMALAAAECQDVVVPIAPDGRYELTPVLQVTIRRADLATLGAMADQLRSAAIVGGDEPTTAAIRGFARSGGTTPERLAARAARLHAALSPGWDEDAEVLSRCLAPCGGRVVLTRGELDRYDNAMHRFMAVWHRSDEGRVDPLVEDLYEATRP